FKLGKFPFQFPLYAGPVIGIEKSMASRRGARGFWAVAGAGRNGMQGLRVRPHTRPSQETVFQALPCHSLQTQVTEMVTLGGANIFMRHIRSRHSLVISRQRHR